AHYHRPKHAVGGKHRRRQFSLRAGAARRHGVRIVLAQYAEPGADGPSQRRSRSPALQLARRDIASRPRLLRWVTAPIRPPADLFTQEFIVGGAGAGSSLNILPTVFNHVLGTKFRVIPGYKGTTDTILAMERGEVHGACASYGQFRIYDQLIRDGKLVFLLRAEETPIPEIPEVPSIFDYAKTDEQHQLMRFIFSSTEFGRPYALPPDVPSERVAIMREAFAAAVRDPDLVAEAARIKLDMTYRPPDHLERLSAALYQTPPALIETVKKLVPSVQ